MNPQFVKDTITKLMDLFERQDFPEVLAHSIIRRHPEDIRPSDRWSIANRLLMVLAGTHDARGYRQWLDVGRHVRKGESSLKIIAPISKKGIRDPESGEEPPRQLFGFCPISVFAIEATEGAPLPSFDYKPKTLPPLWCVADRLGIDVTYRPYGGKHLGYYQPGTRRIELNSQDAFVYYHEVSHAIHHAFAPIRPGNLARAEVVAEMSAAVLCQLQNVTGFEHSAYNYLSRFACSNDPTAVLAFVMSTLSDVEKVVLRALEIAEEAESSTADCCQNSISA